MSIVDRYYGKAKVRLMHVARSGMYHVARELKVNAFIVLNSDIDYTQGDNRDVVPTDTVKNTIYALAKKHGIKTIEEFALLLAEHFLSFYGHVLKTSIEIEEVPWSRILIGGQEHSHAFVSGKETGTRFCKVTQAKGGVAQLIGGLKELRVLKTTQSGFVNFHRDQYTTLNDVSDRIFSTVVYSTYEFNTTKGVNFDAVAKTVKDAIIYEFAGPVSTGLFSPSVQKTMFDAAKNIIAKEPSVSLVEMQMPNIHYWTYDLSKLGFKENKEVFFPTDDPNGYITIKVGRQASKL